MSLNNFTAIGRLTANPELKMTQSGQPYTKFSIAIDRDYKDKNGERKADFATIAAWDKTAELICQYFSKGRMIAIVGQFRNNVWTDKQGNKHYDDYFEARSISFCGDKAPDAAPGGAPAPSQQPQRQNAAPAQQTAGAGGGYYTPSSYTSPQDTPQFETVLDDDELPF